MAKADIIHFMRRSFKYRLYPTSAQHTALNKQLDCCRFVYNKALEARKEAWEQRRENLSRYDTVKMLPGWKTEHKWLKEGHAEAMQETMIRLDLAFRAFFRRIKADEKPGYPHFKSRDRYDSFTYPRERGNWRILDNGRIRLSKIGNVKIRMHRPVEGQAKTLTIKRDQLGKWWTCFSCIVKPKPLPPSPRAVGADVGLTYFVTLSTGEHIPNPRFFRKDEKALAKAQCRLNKCTKDTPEYRKRKRVIQHIHQRIADRRKDFAHKLSRRLVDEFQIIVFEDLDIQQMQDGNWRSMNKSISDAGWAQLRQYTEYKAESANRTYIAVNPRNTTQECSNCGEIVPKDLSIRVHECPYCNLVLDRDVNASLNVLARGLACVGSIPRSSSL